MLSGGIGSSYGHVTPGPDSPQQNLLVDGLEKLALVFPHLGVINLLHQLGVFVDEPCFPEYIGGCVLHLRGEKAEALPRQPEMPRTEQRPLWSASHMYIYLKIHFCSPLEFWVNTPATR